MPIIGLLVTFSFYFSVFPNSTFVSEMCFFSGSIAPFMKLKHKYKEGANRWSVKTASWNVDGHEINKTQSFLYRSDMYGTTMPIILLSLCSFLGSMRVSSIWYDEWVAPLEHLLVIFEIPLFDFAWVKFCLLALAPWNAQIWNYKDKISSMLLAYSLVKPLLMRSDIFLTELSFHKTLDFSQPVDSHIQIHIDFDIERNN